MDESKRRTIPVEDLPDVRLAAELILASELLASIRVAEKLGADCLLLSKLDAFRRANNENSEFLEIELVHLMSAAIALRTGFTQKAVPHLEALGEIDRQSKTSIMGRWRTLLDNIEVQS